MFTENRKQFIDRLKKDVEQYKQNINADVKSKNELDKENFNRDADALRKDWEKIGNDFPIR